MSRDRSRSRTLARDGHRTPQKQTSLIISDTNCEEFDVPAQVGDSIKTVKGYIRDKTGIPEEQMDLWWKGEQLEDNRILTDIAITLDLNVVFTIIVRKVSGEELTVITEANECVVAVKESIQKALKIPRHQQKLVFDTTVLRNHGTMTEYGIHSQSVVTLVITDSQIDR